MDKNLCVREFSNKVIILNKPFLGGWLDENGHIGHEIIDFLKTDDGNYYVYNNPWGTCPDYITCEDNVNESPKNATHIAKYLVLTSETKNNEFFIQFVIELQKKLHNFHKIGDKDSDKFKLNQKKISELIERLNITYNGKFLNRIFDDESLYVTFKGIKIYKAEKPILITGMKYIYQRNKGYVKSDDCPSDYSTLEKKIEESIGNGELVEFDVAEVKPETIGKLDSKATFLNLACIQDKEQVYTNILYSVLQQGEVFKNKVLFCT